MDQKYFDHKVAYQSKTVDEFEVELPALQSPPADRAQFAHSIFHKRFNLLILCYSRGEDLSEIRRAFPTVVESWHRYLAMPGHEPNDLGGTNYFFRQSMLLKKKDPS